MYVNTNDITVRFDEYNVFRGNCPSNLGCMVTFICGRWYKYSHKNTILTVPRLPAPQPVTNRVISLHFGIVLLLIFTLIVIPKRTNLNILQINYPTVLLVTLVIICAFSTMTLMGETLLSYQPLVSSVSCSFLAFLDLALVNFPKMFSVYRLALTGTSDHCTLFLHPSVYFQLNSITRSKISSRIVIRSVCTQMNMNMLRDMLSPIDISVFPPHGESHWCGHLYDHLNFGYDICCPLWEIISHPASSN